MEEGEGVSCLQLQRAEELADTAVFCTKKLGNLETRGHLRQGTAAGIFPLSPSKKLLITFHFEETQESMCAGSWESCSLLTGWEENRKGQEQSVFT